MPDLKFEGLSLSTSPSETLLDGLASEHRYWSAVGYKHSYQIPNGSPSWKSLDNNLSGIRTKTQLFVYIGKILQNVNHHSRRPVGDR